MSACRSSRIYLVGFMGSGKTTVGEIVAKEVGYRFVDLDREVETRRGSSIAEIFERDGEAEFRRLEALALSEIAERTQIVVATGGGTLTRPESREVIRRTGLTVWLDAPMPVLIARCRSGDKRPLLAGAKAMQALWEARLPGYRQADLRVEVHDRTPEEIARWIVSRMDML